MAGWVCLAAGLASTITAEVVGADSIFAWLNASACIALAAFFFSIHVRSQSALRGARAATPQANVFLVIVLVSLFSPLVKSGIEAMRPAADGPGTTPSSATVQPIINKVTCPVLNPNPYACRNGRCPARGR